MLDYVVDEFVQVYAATALLKNTPPSVPTATPHQPHLFEGTNEINRMIITGFVLKRAMSGQLALLPANQARDGRSNVGTERGGTRRPLAAERRHRGERQELGLLIAGAASQKFMQTLPDQQEICGALADMIIETYAMESCLARTQKLVASRGDAAKLAIAMTQGLSPAKHGESPKRPREVSAAVAEGDMLRTQLAIVRPTSQIRAFQHCRSASADCSEND